MVFSFYVFNRVCLIWIYNTDFFDADNHSQYLRVQSQQGKHQVNE